MNVHLYDSESKQIVNTYSNIAIPDMPFGMPVIASVIPHSFGEKVSYELDSIQERKEK